MPDALIMIRKEPTYRREAFITGLQRVGYTTVTGIDPSKWTPKGRDDLLVLWNRKAGSEEKSAEIWEARGGTVLVVENGYLQKVDKTTYAISVHQHNGAGWIPFDATEDRFSKLGIPLQPMKPRPPVEHTRVLIAAQRGIGSKLMASPALWGETQLKKLGGKHAWLRAHPGNFKPRVPLAADLALASDVLIWSSSVGVHALVAGIPVYHHAPRWICEGIGPGSGMRTREAALNYMAHGQWTVDEIASGEPFARMLSFGWGDGTWH